MSGIIHHCIWVVQYVFVRFVSGMQWRCCRSCGYYYCCHIDGCWMWWTLLIIIKGLLCIFTIKTRPSGNWNRLVGLVLPPVIVRCWPTSAGTAFGWCGVVAAGGWIVWCGIGRNCGGNGSCIWSTPIITPIIVTTIMITIMIHIIIVFIDTNDRGCNSISRVEWWWYIKDSIGKWEWNRALLVFSVVLCWDPL